MGSTAIEGLEKAIRGVRWLTECGSGGFTRFGEDGSERAVSSKKPDVEKRTEDMVICRFADAIEVVVWEKGSEGVCIGMVIKAAISFEIKGVAGAVCPRIDFIVIELNEKEFSTNETHC